MNLQRKIQLLIKDRKFPVLHDELEVKTVSFQNRLQFPAIKLAKRCRSKHCAGFQSRIHNLVPLFAGKTIGIAVIWKELQMQPGGKYIIQLHQPIHPVQVLILNKSMHILFLPNESSPKKRCPRTPSSALASSLV